MKNSIKMQASKKETTLANDTAQPGTKAAQGPPDMSEIEPLSEPLQAGSSWMDYGHTGSGRLHNPTVPWPFSSGKRSSWVSTATPWCCAQEQFLSPQQGTKCPWQKRQFTQGDHMLRVLSSPFIPWNDVADACGETLLWYLGYKHTDARNKKHYTKEEIKNKLNKPKVKN